MPKLGEYLQIKEAAEYLGVCRETLRNWEATGKIVVHRHPMNNYRLYRIKDLDGLIRETERSAAPALLPQSILIAGKPDSELQRVITGNCPFTTEGLGLTPGNQFSLIQCSQRPEESAVLGGWFTSLWNTLPGADQHKVAFLARLQALFDPKAPSLIYYLVLFHVFKDLGNELDEERIVKSAIRCNLDNRQSLFAFELALRQKHVCS